MASNGAREAEAGDEQWDCSDEAAAILDAAAAAGGCEVEHLPQETIRTNEQRQEDELLALQAIYGDDVVILDRRGGLQHFEINVLYEFPDGTGISARLPSAPGSFRSASEDRPEPSSDSGPAAGFLYNFNLCYLPPLTLSCLLPLSYPSNRPPHFVVASRWLEALAVSSLCHQLDTIWTEQAGMEVLYQWVEWLRNSALPYLGFDSSIILGGNAVSSADRDVRAVSRSLPLESIIPSLINYSVEKGHEIFLKNLHLCEICYSEELGSEFISLPCKHFFCCKCMETYSRMHVKEGSVIKLVCPNSKCDIAIPPYLLKRLLGEEDFGRWESFTLQRALDTMSDVVYCPRCRTPCLKEEDNNAQCSKCFFNFCSLCSAARHVGQKCLSEEEKLKQLQARQQPTGMTDEQLRKQEELINEMLSIREIFKDAKPCPKCKVAISRSEGCNKMICQNCGQYFCFRCNKAIEGYDHFRGGCVLFPEEETQIQEEDLQEYQVIHQIRSQLNPDLSFPCPNCRVLNIKLGENNHLFCWACQIHYCAICNLRVKKRAQHYAATAKCKQFTP